MALEAQVIKVRRGGCDSSGQRIKNHPELGMVEIWIESGPGRREGIRLDFSAAKDFGRALREPMYALRLGNKHPVQVMHLGNGAVVVERAGKAWFAIKPDPFKPEQSERARCKRERDTLANRISQMAGLAEQDIPAVSEKVALDQATLARTGFQLGLTKDRQILEAAKHEAVNNDQLRRYMPLAKLNASIAMPVPSLKVGSSNPVESMRESLDRCTTEQEEDEIMRALRRRAQEART